jgi:hypothetical protein
MPFGTDVSSSPALAVDARGDAVIAWTAYGAGGEQVRAAYRLAGRAWQPPRTLSLTGEIADDPRVALDARGRALVVWRARLRRPVHFTFAWRWLLAAERAVGAKRR